MTDRHRLSALAVPVRRSAILWLTAYGGARVGHERVVGMGNNRPLAARRYEYSVGV